MIRQIREANRDAKHNVFAYIAGGTARYSDDGEPGGSAGLPVMNVLSAEGVSSVCCVVTRYFGGALLGFGGLQRAYTRAAQLALASAGIGERSELSGLKISCAYSLYERVIRFLDESGAVAEDTDFGTEVTISAWLGEDKLPGTVKALMDLSNGAISIHETKELRAVIKAR
jgi:putative IMPACT (imprinted ancient) family translation regulator